MRLKDIQTPALILDANKMAVNIERMATRMSDFGVPLRPHLKTAKCAKVADALLSQNAKGITVSTLAEAAYFLDHGIKDITYAVCVTPNRFDQLDDLQCKGAHIKLIVDSLFMAESLNSYAGFSTGMSFDVLIEIDSGEGRTGILPDDPTLLDIAKVLHAGSRTNFAGVLTHGGHAYGCHSLDEIKAVAQQERETTLFAVKRLKEAGLPCKVVSIGSTPTASQGDNFDGITELRAGVYVFGDLFQASIESHSLEDMAVSVLTTIISHRVDRNQLIVDAGGLALSKDRSTAKHGEDMGYGLVASASGDIISPHMTVEGVHQEHGEITSSRPIDFEQFPIGSQLRIFPNHVCMTAAPYDKYHVITDGDDISEIWDKHRGW